MTEEICKLIRDQRKALNLTQQQLGEMCGYTGRNAESMVQQWEHGRSPVPINKLRALAEALQLTLDELIP